MPSSWTNCLTTSESSIGAWIDNHLQSGRPVDLVQPAQGGHELGIGMISSVPEHEHDDSSRACRPRARGVEFTQLAARIGGAGFPVSTDWGGEARCLSDCKNGLGQSNRSRKSALTGGHHGSVW